MASPLPRLSACMAPPSTPLVEFRPGPLQVTLAIFAGPRLPIWGCANANIAQSLAVPATLIAVFVALMMALPLACCRNLVLLLPSGLAVLLMVTLSVTLRVVLAVPGL